MGMTRTIRRDFSAWPTVDLARAAIDADRQFAAGSDDLGTGHGEWRDALWDAYQARLGSEPPVSGRGPRMDDAEVAELADLYG